eukprot:12206046-Alexandrium_andersonii.AAC.1
MCIRDRLPATPRVKKNYLASYLIPAMIMMATAEQSQAAPAPTVPGKPIHYKVNFCDEDEGVYLANSFRNHVRGVAEDIENDNGWNELSPPAII